MSAVEHSIHPLSLRVYNDPDFFLTPKSDIICSYCFFPCSIGPPVCIPMRDSDLEKGNMCPREITYHIDRPHIIDVHKLYCSIECMWAAAQINDLEHVNALLRNVFNKPLNHLTIRRALHFATLQHFGGPLTREQFIEFNNTGKIAKYQKRVYFHESENPASLTTQRLRMNMALQSSKKLMPFFNQKNWTTEDIRDIPNFWKQSIKQSCESQTIMPRHGGDEPKVKSPSCWNDGYPLLDTPDCIPLPCILKYDTKNESVQQWCGVFCSLACINSYLIRINNPRVNLLIQWNQEFYSHHLGGGRLFSSPRSPSRRMLQKFGGDMSIQTFRNIATILQQNPMIPRFIREPPFRSFGNCFAVLNGETNRYTLIYTEQSSHVLEFMHCDGLTSNTTITNPIIMFEKRYHVIRPLNEQASHEKPTRVHFVLMTVEEPQERQSDAIVALDLVVTKKH